MLLSRLARTLAPSWRAASTLAPVTVAAQSDGWSAWKRSAYKVLAAGAAVATAANVVSCHGTDEPDLEVG